MSEPFDPYLHWLGIRDPNRPPNHYRLLGVDLFENDGDVLANAADRQMAHVRTFQAGKHSAESQRLLNELAAAKVCLLNAAKKAEYDAALLAQQSRLLPPLVAPPPPPPPPPPLDLPQEAAIEPAAIFPLPPPVHAARHPRRPHERKADRQLDRPVVRDVRSPDIDRGYSLDESSPQQPGCREQGKAGPCCGCPAGKAKTGASQAGTAQADSR